MTSRIHFSLSTSLPLTARYPIWYQHCLTYYSQIIIVIISYDICIQTRTSIHTHTYTHTRTHTYRTYLYALRIVGNMISRGINFCTNAHSAVETNVLEKTTWSILHASCILPLHNLLIYRSIQLLFFPFIVIEVYFFTVHIQTFVYCK